MDKKKKLTIVDIARHVGVSTATVSRCINGHHQYMSAKTRQKIIDAIKELNYRPNNLARGLKSNQTRCIGVSIAYVESPATTAILRGIYDACQEHGYMALVIINDDNDDSRETEQENLQSLLAQQVDGLIVMATDKDNPFLVQLASESVPLVLLDRVVESYNFDAAYIENAQMMKQALSHLFNAGFQNVACFLPEYEKLSPRYLRHDAFVDFLSSKGFENPEKYVFVIDPRDSSSVRENILRFWEETKDEGPAAIFACTGITLFSVYHALYSLNLQIPAQIGLCGMDDWDWAETMDWAYVLQPGITTMCAPTYSLGKKAVELLINRLHDRNMEQQIVFLPSVMKVRSSSKING